MTQFILNFFSVLESKNDTSATNFKAVSSPRIIIPNLKSPKSKENIDKFILSVQKAEEKICALSQTVDSLFKTVNMKQDQLNKQDQQIQELTKQYNKSSPINQKLENLEKKSTENNDNFKQLENRLNSLELTIRKSSESNTERQMDLHSTNKELVMENKQLKSKVVELEQQLTKESRLVDENKVLLTENTD